MYKPFFPRVFLKLDKSSKVQYFFTLQTTSESTSGNSLKGFNYFSLYEHSTTSGFGECISAYPAFYLSAGSVEYYLLVSAALASDLNEPALGLYVQFFQSLTSMSSNFFDLKAGGCTTCLQTVHLYFRYILLVGFSLPSGFGLGKPPYPLVTLLNLLWPHLSSLAFFFFLG